MVNTTELNESLKNNDRDVTASSYTIRMLNSLPPSEAAHFLETLHPSKRLLLWGRIDDEYQQDVFEFLDDDTQAMIISRLDRESIREIASLMESDDLADMMQEIPEELTEQVLSSMDSADRSRVEQILEWEEDTAGGLMNTDTISIRAGLTVDVVLRFLRRHDELPEATDTLMVVSRINKVVGVLPILDLLVAESGTTVREIMQTRFTKITAETDALEVANLFERRDLISAPVVDDNGILLGRITIDDVVDVIKEEADQTVRNMAGLNEDDDTFATVGKTVKLRAIWLMINLICAFTSASVIGAFEGTIEKVVALAVLMPIVASMGGIAGTQTLTLLVRGIATGEVASTNYLWIFFRELKVGIINGVLFSFVVGVTAWVWFGSISIACIIGTAIICNLIIAALAGASLPNILTKMNIDPALAGGVILTTFTDVMGFLTFLGLATIFLV